MSGHRFWKNGNERRAIECVYCTRTFDVAARAPAGKCPHCGARFTGAAGGSAPDWHPPKDGAHAR